LCALPRRVHPEDTCTTAVGLAIAFEDLDRGGLAGAIRAQEGEHLACLDREAQAIDDRAAAIALHEVNDLNGR
jgi:hypothetical protein